jgi:serine/threonine protein kinase
MLYEILSLGPPFKGNSMKQLAKRVLKGLYPSIPKCYSTDLSNIVRVMLSVSPSKRPNISQLTAMPAVARYMKNKTIVASLSEALLSTIHLPHDLSQLRRRLPEPIYTG